MKTANHVKMLSSRFEGKKLVKHQVWPAYYPPTKEFIRIGSKPPSINADEETPKTL